jgi:hypothetical protein
VSASSVRAVFLPYGEVHTLGTVTVERIGGIMSVHTTGTRGSVKPPKTPAVVGPDGLRHRLRDLPLVAFRMSCGHLGRDYAIRKGDIMFCQDCGADKRITKVLAE